VAADDKPNITIVGYTGWLWNAEADWKDAFEAEGFNVIFLDELATEAQIRQAAKRSELLLWISSRLNHSKRFMSSLSRYCVTAGWHADLFWGLSRPNWKRSAMWAADFVFTADGGHAEDWEKMGVNHKWLLPGVRRRWTQDEGRLRASDKCDVAFIGSNGGHYHKQWTYRADLIAALREMCERNGWKFKNPGGDTRRLERNRRMNDFYRSAKVTVGDSLCLDREKSLYWSDRVYEATGRGGLLIMPKIEALSVQSENQVPMYGWGDWTALERKIGAFLSDSGANADTRSVCRDWTARNHTYNNRVRTLLEETGVGNDFI
jgi:hypothetical protein